MFCFYSNIDLKGLSEIKLHSCGGFLSCAHRSFVFERVERGRLIQKFMIQKSNFANPNPFGGVLFIYINFNYMYVFLNFTSVFYMLSKGERELHSNSIFYM